MSCAALPTIIPKGDTSKFALNMFYGLTLILVALYAVFSILDATPHGLGTINDSAAYIAGARSLAAGNGYGSAWLRGSEGRPITHYPPLTSVVVFAIGLATDNDPTSAFRALNAALIGANAILLGMILKKASGSPGIGAVSALLYAMDGALVTVHAYAISEPLYLFAFLLACRVLQQYDLERKSFLIAAAGALVSLSILTRYAGVAPALALATALWFASRKRKKDAALFAFGAFPPLAAWATRNILVAGTANDYFARSPHPIPREVLAQGWANVVSWTDDGRQAALGVVLVAACIAVFAARRKSFRPDAFVLFVGLHVVAYTALAFVSAAMADEQVKFNLRILSPLFLSLIALFAWLMGRLWNAVGTTARAAAFILIMSLLVVRERQTAAFLSSFRDDGHGYTAKRYQEGRIAQFLKNLPRDVELYSNSPPAVYLVTNGQLNSHPLRMDDLSAIVQSAPNDTGLALVFYGVSPQNKLKIEKTIGVPPFFEYGWDVVYYWPSAQRGIASDK